MRSNLDQGAGPGLQGRPCVRGEPASGIKSAPLFQALPATRLRRVKKVEPTYRKCFSGLVFRKPAELILVN
jgi:hypothetical protein